MTLQGLKKGLASADGNARAAALREFYKGGYDVKALPLLRRALADKYVQVVIDAARCVGKLGPAALDSPAAEAPVKVGEDRLDLVTQLMLAGSKVWAYSGYANCYGDCLDALVKIGADPDELLDYIHDHIGLSSPDDLLQSLAALKAIGTPESHDLFGRAVAFWRPELNKTFTRKVDALSK